MTDQDVGWNGGSTEDFIGSEFGQENLRGNVVVAMLGSRMGQSY